MPRSLRIVPSLFALASTVDCAFGAEWSFKNNDPRTNEPKKGPAVVSSPPENSQQQLRGGGGGGGGRQRPLPQPLEFIHITKTGGTAVELAGARVGLHWGACHYGTVKRRGRGCTEPDLDRPSIVPNPVLMKPGVEQWHAPPHWLEPNPLEGLNTFVVVRNPYDRLISEYYCHSTQGFKGENAEDPQTLNDWLGMKLQYAENAIKGEELWHHGHLIPQHFYTFDDNNSQIVAHILRYENIQTEFDNLMKDYNLPARLPPNDEIKAREKEDGIKESSKVSIHDISPENIAKANEIYDRDFALLGYDKIDPTSAAGSAHLRVEV